jgi:hypothetical protein
MRDHLIPASLLCLGLMLACGGGGGTSYSVAPAGNLTLRFGSDSIPGYDQAVVSLEKVEGSPDGFNWTLLGNVKATFDLVGLQNGHSAVILPAAKVNAGTYKQFRITWATANYNPVVGQAPNPPAYVVPTGQAGQALAMPVTTVVDGPLTVPANGSAAAQIMLSGQQAIQLRPIGTNEAYTFQATGSAYDLAASATITGHLASGTTSLAGAEVFAETLDGTLLATIQRRAFSDGTGSYVLEGLATGNLYFVASQPAGTISAYSAAASSPVNAITATTYTANLSFSASVFPGSLLLSIYTPSTATQGTWGELRQNLPTGSAGSANLIVRSQTALTSLAGDQVGFLGLAPGPYGVAAQRSTSGGTPVMKTGTTVQVSASGTATPTLSYP